VSRRAHELELKRRLTKIALAAGNNEAGNKAGFTSLLAAADSACRTKPKKAPEQ
jgi:hypothetical protein